LTNIFDAINNDSLEQLKKAIEEGDDVNKANSNGFTPLLIAAYRGHLDVVEYLVGKGADVNQANNNDVTPLFFAAQEGHLEVVQHLLKQRGIEVNKADNDGATPLYVAAYRGHSEIVQHLLAQGGIDVNKANEFGVTPLLIAAQEGHVNIGANLLIHGANSDGAQNISNFSEFYDNAIKNIAQGILEYDEYRVKKLAFAMGDHPRLGAQSHVRNIDYNNIKTILDLAGPPKIELNKMQQQHRDAVQQKIEELKQGKVAPGSNVAANGVTQISPDPDPHQL
jgi:ankyrin repeat protein